MTRLLPKFGVVDVGADDLGETSTPVLLLDEVDETIEDDCAFGLEEATSGTQLVEEEKFLILREQREGRGKRIF